MTAAITTKQIRDGAGNLMSRQVVDISGTGAGPFVGLQIFGNAAGTGILDFEALNDALVEAIGDAAVILPGGAATDAGLAAILAKLSSDPATGAGLTAILNKLTADPATQTTLASVLAKLNAGLQLVAGTAVIGKVVQQVASADVSVTNPVPVGGAQLATVTATIASGASLSGAADLGTGRLVGLIMPAAWTTAAITFQGSADGANYFDLYDDNIERAIASGSALASRFIALPIADWLMIRSVKLRSGSSASPVPQGADRAITLVTAR